MRPSRRFRNALLAACLLAARPAAAFDAGRDGYLMRCGGCHGIEGTSVPGAIPSLRGTAGRFLCSAAARAAFTRLPNVRMSLLNDDLLAQVLNFVAFDLGGASAPAGARRFTAAEVHASRSAPPAYLPALPAC